MDKAFCNVIILGFAFMFVFTAFQTCGMIEKLVIKGIKDSDDSYTGDAYVSLSIIYAVFSLSNWLAPSIISFTGSKYAMFIGGITYVIFIANFLYPVTWVLYFCSALIGVGAAVIWTGQGNFLTVNSNSTNMARNSGIFWALLQCSLLFGNLFVFLELEGKEEINKSTRMLIFGVLLGVGVLGLILLLILRGQSQQETGAGENTTVQVLEEDGPVQALVKAFQLLKTKDMILLSITFFYTGLELSFFSGVYGACLGSTSNFGSDAQKYAGMSGIFIGAGEILGGALFGLLGKKTNKFGRDPIILLGYIVHILSFYLIFINLPPDSPLHTTSANAFFKSSVYIAIFCSFTLGFGDACYNTQVYSILGYIYREQSTPAFALFKFFQSVAAAVAFGYSTKLNLYYQLFILVIFATIGSFTFWRVEWKQTELKLEKERQGTVEKNNEK